MWKSLRAVVEDGVKEFSREALSEAASTLSDGRKVVRDTAGRLDVDGARDLAGRAVQRLRSQGSSQGRLADVQLHAEASASQDNDVQIPMTSNPVFDSESGSGADSRQARPSSEWASVSLSRAESPKEGAQPAGAAGPMQSHSSDDIASSWLRTAESGISRAVSVSSDMIWGDSDGLAPHSSQDGSSVQQASEGFSALLGHKRPSSRSSSAEGRRPQGTHRRRSSDCSSPARELHQEVVRLQAELDRMAQRLKEEQGRSREAEAKLQALSSNMQQRLLQLATEVEARGNALERIREENDSLTNDYNSLRAHLAAREADAEAKINELQQELQQAQHNASRGGASRESSAESEEARTAREDMEARLEAAVTKARAAAEAATAAEHRAVAAEAAREEAMAARSAAERSRRETEAQAQAAAAAAEAERNERAAAEGLSEQLKAEADRRAKVFHNAVKAAVGRVQAELEAERDCLQTSVRQLEAALAFAREEAATAKREAAARTRDAEDAGSMAVSAQEAADTARAAAAQAASQLKEAQRQMQPLQQEIQEATDRATAAEASAERLEEQLKAEQQITAAITSLERDVVRWKEQAQAAAGAAREAEVRAQAASASSAAQARNAREDANAARAQVASLERELAELRQQRSSRTLAWPFLPGELLSSLGLDRGKEERLLATVASSSSADLEAASKRDISRSSARGGVRQLLGKDLGLRGQVSTRTWIIIVYLIVLHLAVMLSFTRQHDVHAACQEHVLPGA